MIANLKINRKFTLKIKGGSEKLTRQEDQKQIFHFVWADNAQFK